MWFEICDLKKKVCFIMIVSVCSRNDPMKSEPMVIRVHDDGKYLLNVLQFRTLPTPDVFNKNMFFVVCV